MMSTRPTNPDDAAKRDVWRIDHQIPIAVIVTLVLQTGAGVWFIANLSAKVDRTLETLAEFKAERYTKTDAQKDRELFLEIVKASHARDAEQDRRLNDLERRNGR